MNEHQKKKIRTKRKETTRDEKKRMINKLFVSSAEFSATIICQGRQTFLHKRMFFFQHHSVKHKNEKSKQNKTTKKRTIQFNEDRQKG
jgi:hypothetical protein